MDKNKKNFEEQLKDLQAEYDSTKKENDALKNEKEKLQKKIDEGKVIPTWAVAGVLIGLCSAAAYAGYTFGYGKGKEDCDILVINSED